MNGLRRSIAFSAVERYGAYVIGLAGMAGAARLLTPRDFGVFALASILVVLVDVLRDFGTGSYIVQLRELTREAVRGSVTVMLLISLGATLLLAAAALPAAAFFNEPELTGLMLVIAAASLTNPLATPPAAMLRRDMAFDTLAAIGLFAAFLQVSVLLLLAWQGFGAASLAWGSLAAGLGRAAASNLARPVPWAFRPSFSGWRPALVFGGWSSATAFVNVLHGNAAQLLLGRLLGAVPVGLYDRALTICMLPDRLVVSAMNPVLLPALAEHVRRGGTVREPYLLGLRHMAAVQWPALVCLILLADPIVMLLLGPQWHEVPHLVRLMAGGMFWLVPAFLSYPTLVVLGRVRETLTTSLITVPPSLAVLTFAAMHSLEAVAASSWITAPLQIFVVVSVIRRHTGILWREILGAVAPGAVVALASVAGPLAAMSVYGFRLDLPLGALLIAVPVSAMATFVALRASGHPLQAEIESLVALLLRRWSRA